MKIVTPYDCYYQSLSSPTTINSCFTNNTFGTITMRRAAAELDSDTNDGDGDDVDYNGSNLHAQANMAAASAATVIVVREPLPFDVLCGRDRNYNKHPGNQVYRNMLAGHVSLYSSDIPKQEKMNITRSILSTMEHRYGSRFIRRCSMTSSGNNNNNNRERTTTDWEVLSHMQARDKISHALRNYYKQNEKKVNSATATTTNVAPINDNSNHQGVFTANSRNIDTETTTAAASANIALPPLHMRNERIEMMLRQDDIGISDFGSFDNDDDISLTFDDATAYMDLFGSSGSSPSKMSITAANLHDSNSSRLSLNQKPASTKINDSTCSNACADSDRKQSPNRKRKGS